MHLFVVGAKRDKSLVVARRLHRIVIHDGGHNEDPL